MQIDIYSDPICPWCFIGKRRFERALALRPAARPAIRWRPFQLNPDMPQAGMDRQDYLAFKFGGPARARKVYAAIAAAGQSEGIGFRFDAIARTPSTRDAHRLIAHAEGNGGGEGRQDALNEALFTAYFLEGKDIGDHAVLVAAAAAAGMDADAAAAFLAGEDGAAEVRAADTRARRMGITGVPCFIFDGRYAVAGAQEPEAFLPLFDLGAVDAAAEALGAPAG